MSLSSRTSSQSVFSLDELFARCMGNTCFAERILVMFQDRFAHDLEELDQAVGACDAAAVARTAHRIKGAAANVAAAQLRERAAEIEQLGRAGLLCEVPQCVAQLRQAWFRFVQAVAALELGSCSAY